VAPSSTSPGRGISHADGQRVPVNLQKKKIDLYRNQSGSLALSLSFFLKKISSFCEINPRPPLLGIFMKKIHNFYKKECAVQPSYSGKIANKPLSYHKINLSSWSSLRNAFRKTLKFSSNQITTCSIRYFFTSNAICTI